MEINKSDQYNQGIGKFKVLSSNAGVGSIVTTKAGFFVMPKSVSEWGFVNDVNAQIQGQLRGGAPFNRTAIEDMGTDIIDDPRFVNFLKSNQELNNLKCLIGVPHLTLNDWGRPMHREHPLFKRCRERTGAELPVEHFIVPAIHFPTWFYSRKDKLFKPLEEWKALWRRETGDTHLRYFAPPRDAHNKTHRTFKDNNEVKDIYETLVQIPILLICKNGHISDIPWYQLFCAGIDGRREDMKNPQGFELFDYPCQDCETGGKHELQWIENRSNSESWGTLKCRKCGRTYSLEGIMNVHPFCKAETPWNGIGTRETQPCSGVGGQRGVMQMALVTSNSVYYANSFSSLYIPPQYLNVGILPSHMQRALDLLLTRWYPNAVRTRPELTKDDYIGNLDLVEKASDSDIELTPEEADVIKSRFTENEEDVADAYEKYRYDEYSVFSGNNRSMPDVAGLEFEDVNLLADEWPDELRPYFKKIQQIHTLAVTMTQLGFSRVSMPVAVRNNGTVEREYGQKIYSQPAERVYALPANQSFGEGIFFEFNRVLVDEWATTHNELFAIRYDQPAGDIGQELKSEMNQYGAPQFYLLHTFAHIILKELEFSCGYPTSSMKERLYYSDRMCGVLIYTADGSEGSMGGLVWQGQPRLMGNIIKSAISHATECSSDPLCWEQDEQLNLAACFSCCLVSETSCEKRNLALDRRILVDEQFGFFKALV